MFSREKASLLACKSAHIMHACRLERIYPAGGSYKSATATWCSSSHLILISPKRSIICIHAHMNAIKGCLIRTHEWQESSQSEAAIAASDVKLFHWQDKGKWWIEQGLIPICTETHVDIHKKVLLPHLVWTASAFARNVASQVTSIVLFDHQ